MTQLERTQQLYRAYLEQADALEKSKNPMEGIFGFGGKSADHPCHEQFIKDLEALLAAFRQEGINSADLRDALALVFFAPQAHQDPVSIYWMLIAAQSVTPGIIPLLSKDDAEALYTQYAQAYPRRVRLPAQKKVAQALEKAAKGS